MLDHLRVDPRQPEIMYWRGKDQHELDFVLPSGSGKVDVIECKWSAAHFDPKNLLCFRKQYPQGKNFVVASNIIQPYTRTLGGQSVTFTGLNTLTL